MLVAAIDNCDLLRPSPEQQQQQKSTKLTCRIKIYAKLTGANIDTIRYKSALLCVENKNLG